MYSPIASCVTTPEGRVEYMNHAFMEVLGYTPEDVPHLDEWWEKAYPEPTYRSQVIVRWEAACAKAIASGAATIPEEYTVVRKDGRPTLLELQAAVVGDRWLVMFTDVSERRRGEEAVRQAQKLESLGVLAGGIAHDFNNLLSAMLGNLNMAQMKQTPGSAAMPYLQNIEGTIGRAAELTRQMLAYSGKGQFVVEPLELNKHVAEITHLLAVSITKKVRLQYTFAPNLPPIEADSAQLQQVVMNLVTNASEAIGDAGGVISIATGLREIEATEVETVFSGQGVEPGSYVTLRVADSGCGMEPEILGRIFDPFFSTKGSGRGLGLSAMLGILRGHKAGIEISSEPGQGSDFQIHFRASGAKLPENLDAVSTTQKDRFHGKVLLVDDEADLRFSFGSMLQHLGFQVVAARDGYEALERFRPGEFVVVFMDLSMPRMDGKEAFLQMKARDPEVKVVLASGYSEQEVVEPLQGLRPAGFIQKPFSLQALMRVLEKALG
jgi:signal transduction histidine kinase